MVNFMSGMVTAGYLIAALFFLRFWRRTKDNLFAIFAVSFLLFAAGQASVLAFIGPHDDSTWTFLLRLAGFVLLLVAIARKNFSRKTG
jgi:peptidoglycan/LPS O-acetylase OafA/YrhL